MMETWNNVSKLAYQRVSRPKKRERSFLDDYATAADSDTR